MSYSGEAIVFSTKAVRKKPKTRVFCDLSNFCQIGMKRRGPIGRLGRVIRKGLRYLTSQILDVFMISKGLCLLLRQSDKFGFSKAKFIGIEPE